MSNVNQFGGDILIDEAQSAYTKVYVIFVEKKLQNSEIPYDDSMVYVAGSYEKAIDWCKRNKDAEDRKEGHDWWFGIYQEAIDGEFSGIKGLVEVLDWDGNVLPFRPLNGYEEMKKYYELDKEAEKEEQAVEASTTESNP